MNGSNLHMSESAAWIAFKHAQYIPPMDGNELANTIRSNHVTLRVRKMNMRKPQNEGAMCGLPLLFRRSGCLPEYCEGFGVSFESVDFRKCS